MKKETAYKHSRQREALFNLLCSTKIHPTAAWLYDELRKDFPHLSQGTVYRNLNILVAHFDADMSLHHHVVCTCCGKVEDVEVPHTVWQESAAAQASGYQIESLRLDFFGLCPDCQKKQSDAIEA